MAIREMTKSEKEKWDKFMGLSKDEISSWHKEAMELYKATGNKVDMMLGIAATKWTENQKIYAAWLFGKEVGLMKNKQ